MERLWKILMLSLFGFMIAGAGNSLAAEKNCYDCHKKAKEAHAKSFVHEPVGKGNCGETPRRSVEA